MLQVYVVEASGSNDWGDSSAKDREISCQCFVQGLS